MNLLLALWVVFVCGVVGVAAVIPNDVWAAIADRIRTPRQSLTERILEENWGREQVWNRSTPTPFPKRTDPSSSDDAGTGP